MPCSNVFTLKYLIMTLYDKVNFNKENIITSFLASMQ